MKWRCWIVLLLLTWAALGNAQKKVKGTKSKRLKLALGAECRVDADCEMMELYCKRESLDSKGKCSMRVGLSHPCSTDNMCLSGYCGDESKQCEFSTRQTVVITIAIVCFSILLMAASAPPSYKELYPETRSKSVSNILNYKKTRRRLRKLREQRRRHDDQLRDDSMDSEDDAMFEAPVSPNRSGFKASPRSHSPNPHPISVSGRESGSELDRRRGPPQRRAAHIAESSSDEQEQGQRIRREKRPSKRKHRNSLPTANGQPLPGKPVPNTSPEVSEEESPASPPSSPEQLPISDRVDAVLHRETKTDGHGHKNTNATQSYVTLTTHHSATTTDTSTKIDYINM